MASTTNDSSPLKVTETTVSSTSPSSVCIVCQVPAKQYCSACKSVNYCSAEHQRQHWKQHKAECRPFRIANDATLGRHVVATRDIAAGSAIFTEAPLIVGPKWFLTERDEQVPVMPCVGCFTPCRMAANQCPKCHWPVCSPDCVGLTNPMLHGVECMILMLGPGPASTTDTRALIDYYRSDALVVLKCLLLQRTNPKKWSELMDMLSHEEERLGSELHGEAERRIVSFLQRNFLQRLKSVEQKSKEKYLKEYDATVLHRICGIIETNYMCINLPSGMELSAVFYTAAMMEHDCCPNCYFLFDYRNNFKISVIAGRSIQKGEHLKIMYSNMLWGTQLRQEHLAITKHFQCKCERCTDPTELGTYFSALLCVGDVGMDCGGIQLPTEPLNAKTEWACDKCPIVINGDEIRYLLTQMTEEVEQLLARKPTIKQIEALIDKLSKFLHPNHYHLFSLKHSLIQLYGTEVGYTMSNLDEAQLEKKVQLCEQLLAICQKLDPHTIRLSIYVGIIRYEMQTVLVERAKRLLNESARSDEDVAKARQSLQVACEHLIQAANVLQKELENVAGKKLSEAVLKAKKDVETMIESK